MKTLYASWISNPATQAVMRMLNGGGYQAWFVGGCVRNALLGEPVSDIDIATDGTPAAVTALAEDAGLTVIPTGVAHGTVTVISEGLPHEITTFRRDVTTDGRRATVAFSTDITEDAKRRDFTMNALYADASGTLHDPLSAGLTDLAARRVRFIGTPDNRIREDYLRILRFFRFHAWYGDLKAGLDVEGLAAIAVHAEGLEHLSAERIGHEIRKLLAAPDPAPSVAAMRASGVLHRVLPGADDTALAPLVHLEATHITPYWPRRLACLGWQTAWTDRLRLSKAERHTLTAIQRALADDRPLAAQAYRHGAETARDAALIHAAMLGDNPGDISAEIARGAAATFPVSAEDLMTWRTPGPFLGKALRDLEADWLDADFSLDKAALLAIDRDRAT